MEKKALGIVDLLAGKRAEILRLAAQYKASNVRVFGSIARGEATPDSDIDLLVDFAPGYTLWDHVGLMQDLEDLLGRKVDVTAAKDLRDSLRPSVMQDAVPL